MSDVGARVAAPGLALAATGLLELGSAVLVLTASVATYLPSFAALLSGSADVLPWLQIYGAEVTAQLLSAGVGAVGGAVVLVGGLRLRRLRSPNLVTVASVVAMLPCCNMCCVLGLFTGAWSLWTLRDDEVAAAMADG